MGQGVYVGRVYMWAGCICGQGVYVGRVYMYRNRFCMQSVPQFNTGRYYTPTEARIYPVKDQHTSNDHQCLKCHSYR